MQSETDFPPDLRALEDHYELIRELGQGGMAAVYLARRRDNGKLVAVKAIRARYLDDPDALRRFAREARTVADLSHPNIVRTEAIEEIGDRAVAIIMEYVAGGTVRDRLVEHGVFSAEDAESVLRDVASALGYAHRRGIVHRDVKPENVFLEKSTGRALLSDFGIARRIEGDVPITMLGASLGTPQYMSPEQIDGRAVDGRTDIYSLGVLGWELLTGLRPWAGENLYGIIYNQKHEELPRITSLRPRVPANLLFAIERALVKDRDRRWQSVDGFLEQLTFSPPPVLSQQPSTVTRTVEDEPTVRFRRPVDLSAAEPNAPVEAGSPGRGGGHPRPMPEVERRERAAGQAQEERGRVDECGFCSRRWRRWHLPPCPRIGSSVARCRWARASIRPRVLPRVQEPWCLTARHRCLRGPLATPSPACDARERPSQALAKRRGHPPRRVRGLGALFPRWWISGRVSWRASESMTHRFSACTIRS